MKEEASVSLINDWEQHRSGSILGSYEKEGKKISGEYVSRWKIVLRVKILHPLNELLLSDL